MLFNGPDLTLKFFHEKKRRRVELDLFLNIFASKKGKIKMLSNKD
jgi:hypothetical protein